MENSKLAVGILLLLSQFSFAQTTSFSLEDAKSYALEHNIAVKNADMDITIAEHQKRETIAMGLPQANITGSFNNFLNLPVQVLDASFFNPNAPAGELVSFRAGTDYSSSATLNVNQLIFNGSYFVGVQLSKKYTEMQANAATLTQEDVLFNVIQTYELAAVSKANVAFMDSIVTLTQNLVEKQQNYLELGLMLQEDMDQLNYGLFSAKQSLTQAKLQYDNALELLKFSMGFPMDQSIEITGDPNEMIESPKIESGDIHSNLSFQFMADQVTLSEFNVKNNKAAYIPTLNGYFQHGYNAYRNEFNFFNSDLDWFSQTSWGLQLNVPILSSGQRYYKTSQAKLALLKNQNSLEQMESSLTMQEIQAKNNLTSARSNYELQQENVRLAQTIYENQVTKQEIGKGNSIVVTQKYNQLVMAQAQLVGSTIELLNAQLALDKLYNNIIKN